VAPTVLPRSPRRCALSAALSRHREAASPRLAALSPTAPESDDAMDAAPSLSPEIAPFAVLGSGRRSRSSGGLAADRGETMPHHVPSPVCRPLPDRNIAHPAPISRVGIGFAVAAFRSPRRKSAPPLRL